MKQTRRIQMKRVTFRCLMIVCLVGILAFGLNAKKAPEAEVTEGYIYFMGGGTWYRMVGSGDATPLVVIHGGPGANSLCYEAFENLADERPIILYDQRGCGYSDPLEDESLWTVEFYLEELKELIRQLGLERVHVLGHSWGTVLAAEYAFTHPSELQSIIMVGPFASTSLWINDQQAYIEELPEYHRDAIYLGEETGDYGSPEYQEAMMVFYQRHLCRLDPWPESFINAMANFNLDIYQTMWGPSEFTCTGTLKDYDNTARLPEINVPTLFACGKYDEATPGTVAYLQSLVPGSELKVFNKSAHMIMLEQPKQFIKKIRNFLRKVEKKNKKKKHK